MNLLLPKSATLYHFTSSHLIERIRNEGLRKGALPWHRCARTGAPLVIRNWHEKSATLSQIRLLRSWERWLDAHPQPTGRDQREQFFPGFQWLTADPSFTQTWCLLGDLPFAKNAWRITVAIPPEKRHLLISWEELCARENPPAAEELNVPSNDWRAWSVFNGWIPPSWFLEVARNTGEHLAPEAVEA